MPRPIKADKNVRRDEGGRITAILKQSVAKADASKRYDKKQHHINLRLPPEYKELIANHIQQNNKLHPDQKFTSVNSFIKTLIDRDFLRIKQELEVDNQQ